MKCKFHKYKFIIHQSLFLGGCERCLTNHGLGNVPSTRSAVTDLTVPQGATASCLFSQSEGPQIMGLNVLAVLMRRRNFIFFKENAKTETDGFDVSHPCTQRNPLVRRSTTARIQKNKTALGKVDGGPRLKPGADKPRRLQPLVFVNR